MYNLTSTFSNGVNEGLVKVVFFCDRYIIPCLCGHCSSRRTLKSARHLRKESKKFFREMFPLENGQDFVEKAPCENQKDLRGKSPLENHKDFGAKSPLQKYSPSLWRPQRWWWPWPPGRRQGWWKGGCRGLGRRRPRTWWCWTRSGGRTWCCTPRRRRWKWEGVQKTRERKGRVSPYHLWRSYNIFCSSK